MMLMISGWVGATDLHFCFIVGGGRFGEDSVSSPPSTGTELSSSLKVTKKRKCEQEKVGALRCGVVIAVG